MKILIVEDHPLVREALRTVVGDAFAEAQIDATGLLAAGRPTAVRPRAALTGRQIDVLRLIAKGLRNKEIAERLKIAEDTVKQHARAAYGVLGVSSRMEAASAAARRGIVLD